MGGVRVDVNVNEVIVKNKKIRGGGVRSGWMSTKKRIKVFVLNNFCGGGGGGPGDCEQRFEVFVKMQKNIGGGGGGGGGSGSGEGSVFFFFWGGGVM